MNANEFTYTNIDERYGDPETVTLDDYRELNPDGEFYADEDGIYESIAGHWEQIAEPAS
jgi:hypothetical protein